MKKDAVQDRLGALWGPSWVDLGDPSWSTNAVFAQVVQLLMKINVSQKRRRRETTWADLGSILVPQSGQNGVPKRAKTGLKKRRKVK